MSYKPALWERITVFAAAIIIVALVILLAWRNQALTDPNLVVMVRIVLSLAVAALGATIPGFLNVSLEGSGLAVRAGGDVEDQPSHRGGRIELLRDTDEGDAMLLKSRHHLGEVE